MSIIMPPELTRLTKANPAGIQKAAAKVVQSSSPGHVSPPKFASLVGSKSTKLSDGFEAGLTGVLAHGAEFGGRRRPKKTYVTHRKTTRYVIRRRTTGQFLAWNPRGYALFPATRRSMAGIRQRILDAVRKSVSGG